MSDKAPDVIPAYGEGDAEAASMDQAGAGAKPVDASAANKALPPDAPVQNHGTTEVDITSRINETADRARQNG